MRIGLFGGTFDPPHEGHKLASLIALRRLGLDQIWWLVTPGNPLKKNDSLPSLSARLAAAKRIANDRRIAVTGFEAEIGARYSYETIAYLIRRCPEVRFVWIMGADNLAAFHRWRWWREIVREIAIAVVDRPGSTLKAAQGRAGQWLARYRVAEAESRRLPWLKPPAYVFLQGPRSDLSSSELRRLRSFETRLRRSSG